MHHKRKRPKNRRAGCLLCKPHKGNGMKGSWDSQTRQEKLAVLAEEAALAEFTYAPVVEWETRPS